VDPISDVLFAPALRMTVDVGNWAAARWALPGGQSGNPCSPHYDDQLPAWRDATGIPIAWTEEEQRRATRHTLRLQRP
jgi:penicillin amidase